MPELVGPQHGSFEALSVSTAAVGFTAATVGNRAHAHVLVEDAAVRYRTDGTDPTASVGTPLEVGDQLKLNNARDIANIRFIRRDGVDATLNSHFGS